MLQLVALDELLGLLRVVLRPESDDSEEICVLLSELLNTGRLRPADGSMGCPEPDEERLVGGEQARQFDGIAGGGVPDRDFGERARRGGHRRRGDGGAGGRWRCGRR